MSTDDKITLKKSSVYILIAIVGVVLAVTIALAIFIPMLNSSKENNDNTGNSLVSDTNTSQVLSDEIEMIQIKTDYCMLKFPSQYEKYLEIQENSADGILTKIFLCNIADMQIKLFEVHFGNSEVGDLLGYITKDEKKTAAYIEYGEFSGDSVLSKEEETTVYAMFEGVNDVVKSIKEADSFSVD